LTRHLTYPKTARTDIVERLHGVEVADPYRWLEDLDNPKTQEWIEAQNDLTFDYLRHIPIRKRLRHRATELWDYEKFGLPIKRGGRYFFTRNDGLQNQSVLYWMPALDAEPIPLLDPNTLSEDGTVAMNVYSPSRDGKLLAYGLSSAGSDWTEWRVRSVDTGEDLDDHLQWVKFSDAAWTADNQGFFYNRYAAPAPGQDYTSTNYHQKLYYHRIGTPQSADTLVYERKDQPEWIFGGSVTEDGRYLVIHVYWGTRIANNLFYKDLETPDAPVVELLVNFDAQYTLIGNDGPVFYFLTTSEAPYSQVIAIDICNPSPNQWTTVLREARMPLESASLVGGRLVASYLKDAHNQLLICDKQGATLHEIALPGLGNVVEISGKAGDPELFYQYTSFTEPGTIYRCDVTTGEQRVFRAPEVKFNPADYVTEQVFYHSKDGTRIPMFLVHRRGVVRNAKTPTLLYGYGGFNISMKPAFSVGVLTWLDLGGVYAHANLRGGGEYGKPWHDAGRKRHKQNVFDDFIAAAEWLVDRGYTSQKKLAIAGGSNGGLLVGACLTQRPDLFGAALPRVGVLDMLRFHKFTIGWAWTSDYGDPANAADFKTLLAYSPYHNIRSGTAYPATLVVTGDHDDRVFPAHSYKFAAALQRAQGGDAPILIRVETRAGHGMGKPTSKLIEELVDQWAFLVKTLGMDENS